MEDKTFNAKNQTLFNINKTNESLNNNINLNSISNIKENEIKNLKISLLNSNTDKNILERNKSNKENENDSLSIKSKKSKNKIPLKSLKTYANKNNSPTTIFQSYSSNIQNNSNFDNKKLFGLKKFYKSKTIKYIDFSKKLNYSLNKQNLSNNMNDIVEEEDKQSNIDKLFSTEINIDNSNINENTKTNTNNTNNYYLNKNLYSKRNLITENNKKYKKYEDPLLIPKEDMIFEEMKKYKCYKYFTKEALNKTSVPFIYIDMKMSPNKPIINEVSKNNNMYKSLRDNKFLQKMIKNGKDKAFLSKRYKRDLTEEKKKELLDKVYRVKTAPDIYKRIEILKGKKDKKKLKNYQNNFLKLVKHNITNKYYESLKDKFNEIRECAEGKYITNFKFIKEIEKNEEKYINNINEICQKYKKFFAKKNVNKIFIKSIGPRLKLPKIEFVQIVKKECFSQDEKDNKNKKKRNLINLKKFMNKTTNKFYQKELENEKNKNKNNFFSSTNYNKFNNNIKSYSVKNLKSE